MEVRKVINRSMDIIPQDLWPLIASFMDNKTKRQLRLASTKWFNIIKYNNFSLYFTKKEQLPAIMDRLSKYSWPIELCFNKPKFYNTLDLVNNLYKLTNLIKLDESKYTEADCTDDATSEDWRQLSTLTNIEFLSLLDYVPTDICYKYTKLTRWVQIGRETDPTVSILSKLSNLQSLNFHNHGKTWPFALIPCPDKLTYLNMYLSASQQYGSDMWRCLTNLRDVRIDFVAEDNVIELQYLTALEHAAISSKILPSFSANTNLTQLSLFSVEEWPVANVNTLSSLTRLKTLCIDVYPEVETDTFNFLTDLTQLRYLFLSGQRSDQYIHQVTLLTNLDNIRLLSFTYNDYGFLSHLTNLTALFIRPDRSASPNLNSIEKLTQLQELIYIGGSIEGHFEDFQVPDLARHTNLLYLNWSGDRLCPDKIINSIVRLTNLDSLCLNSQDYGIKFLADLTNLTYLKMDETISDEHFWNDISNLTKLECMYLNYIDNNDRLSALQNLTELDIESASENFNGSEFTALTSLQMIWFRGNSKQLMYKQELTSLLPYLYYYSYSTKDTE